MLFNSFAFLVFAAAFFPVYLAFRDDPRGRNLVLIGFSVFFYGWWEWRYVPLLLLTALIDYYAGLLMADRPAFRRRILVISMIGNLGILGILKYYDFFAQSLNGILEAAGSDPLLSALMPVLPMGVSFYTFHSMSYAIDVYRGVLEPRRSFATYLAYLTMFPQLVAGPIVRARQLLPQLEVTVKPDQTDFDAGLWLIAGGYFKKVVLADNIAPAVNASFSGGLGNAGLGWWLVMALFSAQIYCDFSGYSDIAIGLSRWMGLRLPENFRHPYLASTLRDFWQRWHITLSTWFRDYVYIPLGGSRGRASRAVFALFVTMLLSGLGHGAAWHFVFWGFVHAVLLVVERWGSTRWAVSLPLGARVVLVNTLILATWVFFRSSSMNQSFFILGQMFSARVDWAGLSLVSLNAWCALGVLIASEVLAFARKEAPLHPTSRVAQFRLAAMILACIYLRGPGSAFIYFQF